MEFENNDVCFWSTVRDFKLYIHRCIPTESVHVWVDRRHQQAAPGSTLLQGSPILYVTL